MLKFFSSLSFISSVAAVSSPSPISSVLFLIVAFTCSAVVLLFSGCEFLGLTLIIVYVGAIAILFLFVVMMLDLKPVAAVNNNEGFYSIFTFPVILFTFLVFLFSISSLYPFPFFFSFYPYIDFFDLPYARDDITSLALVLFDSSLPHFLLAGLLLLVSLLGSIVVTLRRRSGVRRQQVPSQLVRVASLRFYSNTGSSYVGARRAPTVKSMMYGSSGEVPPVALSLIGFQPRATPIREGIVDLHNYIFTYLVFIFFFVFSLFYSIVSDFLFSLRQPTTPIDLVLRKLSVFEGPYLTHFPRLEVIWTVLPAFVLLAIALPSFTLLYAMDEVIDPSLTLKALGHQWYWSYNYTSPFSKSGILSTHSFDSYPLSEDSLPRGGLRLLDVDKPTVLPSLTHVRVLVTSDDVLHSWRVPALGVKVDAVPGRLNQLALYARREGVFYGQCSELCGVNHGFMPIAVRVVSLKEYISWLKQLPGQTLFSHKNFGSFLSALPHKKVRLTTSQKTTIDNVTYSHYSVPSLATVFGFAPWTRSCAGSPYWLLDLS